MHGVVDTLENHEHAVQGLLETRGHRATLAIPEQILEEEQRRLGKESPWYGITFYFRLIWV